MHYYNIRTRDNLPIFGIKRIINMHDYIAICLSDGRHLVLKDRYRCETIKCGFRMSKYPYIIPHYMVNKSDIDRLILQGYEFIEEYEFTFNVEKLYNFNQK